MGSAITPPPSLTALWVLVAGCGSVNPGSLPPSAGGLRPPAATVASGGLAGPAERRDMLTRGQAAGGEAPLDRVASNELAEAPLVAPRQPATRTGTTEQVPRSSPLPNGLYNPMPGGVMAGYRGDTGLDLAGNHLPVYAIAAGTLDYSEPGHTLWTGPGDTPGTVRLRLDQPIPYQGRLITHGWYAHLSELRYHQPEGAEQPIHVAAGEQLGVSGVANGSPHLHLGLLLDDVVSQRWGSYLLEAQIREVLGGYRHRQRLPRAPQPED